MFLMNFAMLQVPKNSVAAKAGLLPTTRGFAGNIVLGDVIVGVNNKPVSYRLLKIFSSLHKYKITWSKSGYNP